MEERNEYLAYTLLRLWNCFFLCLCADNNYGQNQGRKNNNSYGKIKNYLAGFGRSNNLVALYGNHLFYLDNFSRQKMG
jgi:hypothetical protein